LESLIIAADVAHRAGLTLSIDDPNRVRISTNGHAVLAFAAILPETTPRGDLRGIGGVFYALLINRWPAQDSMPSGWTPAALDDAGWPKEPATVDRDIPFLISSAAAGLLRPDSGVGTAATLLTLLRHARADSETVAVQGTSALCLMPVLSAPPAGVYASFRNVDTTQKVRDARRQLTNTILVAAAAICLVAVTSLGDTSNRVLGETNVAAMNPDRLGLSPSTTASTPPPSSLQPVRQPRPMSPSRR
jgi:putative peptidoglycan lipid II flippase